MELLALFFLKRHMQNIIIKYIIYIFWVVGLFSNLYIFDDSLFLYICKYFDELNFYCSYEKKSLGVLLYVVTKIQI